MKKLNTNISVNIYVLQKKNVKYIVAPIRVTEQKKTNHVNLLLLQSYYVDEDKDEDDVVDPDVTPEPMRCHYVWIKDLSRLVRSKLTKHCSVIHIYERCLHYFCSPEKLVAHEIDFAQVNKCSVKLPTQQNNEL